MNSLRTRITLMTVLVVIVALAIVTTTTVLFFRNNERRETEQLLLLLCETGERNLDYYFNSVQDSVEKVGLFVSGDLDGLDDESLSKHMLRVGKYFDEMAYRTNGVLTYYYRIDPEISNTVKGFWYTNLDGKGFAPHEVTDITLYDTSDTSKLVWFTVPKHDGQAIWLPPYITDNLDVRVISYNVPIYWRGQFVGVVGIEIDYSTMAKQVDSIQLYGNGYAFLSSADGELYYHPYIDVSSLSEAAMPDVPEGMLAGTTFFRYTYDGVEKEAVWLPLSNGMRINVAAPLAETEGDWQSMVNSAVIISVAVLMVMSGFTMLYTRRITRPLEQLTAAAEQVDNGNYDFRLDYADNDEVGRLTNTFKRLVNHMKEYIGDLSRRVYVDALTSVKNKGAFADALDALQIQLDQSGGNLAFGIGVFDCNNLKTVNDRHGHDKGDIYLKTACQLICRVFDHSPVFRIGGDEFAVILRKDDFRNRDALIRRFERQAAEINADNEDPWKQVHVAMGIAVFDPGVDHYVIDAVRRADKIMYANKQAHKSQQKKPEGK